MDKYRDLGDIAKDVRQQLKAEFPQCRFSVTISRFSMGESMTISLMRAPFAAFADGDDTEHGHGYAQLNQYQLRQEPDEHICNGYFLTSEAWVVMKRADEIQNEFNWDKSDSSTDYFNVNFWFHPEIGKWNKPFEVL